MTLTSSLFLCCLLPCVGFCYLLPGKWRSYYLLFLSYLFYWTWNPGYLFLLVTATSIGYLAAIGVSCAQTERAKLAIVAATITLLVGTVVFFKCLRMLPSGYLWSQFVVPIGISYYLFKLMSYVLDVYWEKISADRSWASIALYVAFFPQMVSGPIQRAPEFIEQLKDQKRGGIQASLFEKGVGFILLGLFEKIVVADRISPFVAAMDQHTPGTYGHLQLLASYAYYLELFADFSGLTHVALGTGMLFGIEGPPNFDRPFAASNIQEYWRRWHMSLTGWLTDYLFTPLRMALRNLGELGLVLSIVINMILIALWHGIYWTFLVFGIVHGVFMVGSVLTLKKRNTFLKSHRHWKVAQSLIGPVVTFNMVCFALIFFRAESLSSAWLTLTTMFRSPVDVSLERDTWFPALVASLFALFIGTGLAKKLVENYFSAPSLTYIRWVAYGAFGFLLVLLSVDASGQFIYARF